ncbi:DUF2116 family Zn-ribbon domain-containing protein [Candidatus Bathyarchaeota archaeon]|nr:DUF2116 family Zn-ribbon domain-containing protein [Candidatus Bathyarchaeota archaeon]
MSPSKKKSGKKERVFPHRHCSICFKMIPEFSDGYCSYECRNYKKMRKKVRYKKILKYILSYGVIIVLVLVLFLAFM